MAGSLEWEGGVGHFPEHRRCGNVKAQGNALGNTASVKLKPQRGAIIASGFMAPLWGFDPIFCSSSQGVALGFNITAPLVLRKNSISKTDASGQLRSILPVNSTHSRERSPEPTASGGIAHRA